MKDLLETYRSWRADGVGAARAVVIRTFGSAPRPEGATLLVGDDGRLAGSVSGGCVEGAAFEEIQRARREGRSRVIRYGISDEQAWDVGLACGGTIDVLVEPSVRPDVLDAAGGPGGVAIAIPLPSDAPGPEPGPHEPGTGDEPAASVAVDETGDLTGSLGDTDAERELAEQAARLLRSGTSRTLEVGDRRFFIEVYPRRPRLVVVGAVQVAMPLVRIARELGFETVVIDGRATFATRERFPDVDRLILGWPDEMADEIGLGPTDAVAVLTHDVKFDEPAIIAALRRGCRYVGAIGSRKTQADRHARLRAAGVSAEELERVRGPIGLDLGGRSPAETALAIMGEIVAARYGASGGPLREHAALRATPRAVPLAPT
jgi:xanthine dehydrogenase accessory factor